VLRTRASLGLVRVLCCYTRLHPRTQAALARHEPQAELVNVSHSDTAYWEQIAMRWGLGDLAIIEHDIEIHPAVMPQFWACPSAWCSFRYALAPGDELWAGLGCSRFRMEAQRRIHAPLIQELSDSGPPKSWGWVESKIFGAMHSLGISQCIHEPPVKHWNPASL
jgi:hypothetical protein